MPPGPGRPTPLKNNNSSSSSNSNNNILRQRILLSLLFLCLGCARSATFNSTSNSNAVLSSHNRNSHGSNHSSGVNCTDPAIEDFPRDFLTQAARNKGGIVVHILIAAYLIWTLGIICDDYFVPALEIICQKLHMKPDVAGATFMAAGTSAPEFFSNVMGTFITRSDLGIGTIVGSAVFNIFGVLAICGLFTGKKVPLDWYPITRDCVFYGVTIVVLIVVLIDEKVFWYESSVMIVCYFVYITVMYFNDRLEKWAFKTQKRIKSKIFPATAAEEAAVASSDEFSPRGTGSATLSPSSNNHHYNNSNNKDSDVAMPLPPGSLPPPSQLPPLHSPPPLPPLPLSQQQPQLLPPPLPGSVAAMKGINTPRDGSVTSLQDGEGGGEAEERFPWQRPKDAKVLGTCSWILFFPANLIFFLTIPDVRMGPRCARFYPVSFVMCICWIGVLCYVSTWMITIIGYTFSIPDSVMGLSFLAVGTSIPEVISSLIVSRQGHGSMAVSNSIGSNTFDILVCLGLPWFIMSILLGTSEEKVWHITVNSQGLGHTVATLLISLGILYVALLISKFTLSRTLGVICFVIYAIFLTFSILVELNVFYDVNLPMCYSSF